MAIVKGEGCVLTVNNLPIVCARSATINLSKQTIAKSTVGSGKWEEFEEVSVSWTASMEGISYVETNGVSDLWTLILTTALGYARFIVTDISAATFTLQGNAILVNLSQTGSVNNASSFNLELKGTGSLNKV